MHITVVGTGYVGLVSGAIFADFGNQVWGVDIIEDKIKSLQIGEIPFYEPGLKDMVCKNLKTGNLKFTSSYRDSLKKAEIIFICVGTPPKANGDYDLSYVYSAAKSIAKNIKQYSVICIKSTVPPNTGEEVKKIIKGITTTLFDITSCPEFLREGSAIKDTLHPSRIIIGAETKKAEGLLRKLHQPIKAPVVLCDVKSAQLIKYAANSFLATKISFINSIARICDVVGADISKVTEGLGLDQRIGRQFLDAGLGYGGSCFPKDTWALISFAKRLGYDFKFLKEVDAVNKGQIDYFIDKIIKTCKGTVKGKTLSILGLAFKPDTDDMREARSLPIIEKLLDEGARLNVCDPVVSEIAQKNFGDKLSYFKDPYKALTNSSALILVTEWPIFKQLDFKKVFSFMKEKVIIDGRNIYDPNKLKEMGFVYTGIGKR